MVKGAIGSVRHPEASGSSLGSLYIPIAEGTSVPGLLAAEVIGKGWLEELERMEMLQKCSIRGARWWRGILLPLSVPTSGLLLVLPIN